MLQRPAKEVSINHVFCFHIICLFIVNGPFTGSIEANKFYQKKNLYTVNLKNSQQNVFKDRVTRLFWYIKWGKYKNAFAQKCVYTII